MRRIVCLLVGLLLVVPSLGTDAPKEYDGVAEMDDIGGSWLLISEEYEGRKFDAEEGRFGPDGVTYRDGRFTRVDPKEVRTGTYTTDTRHKPARLDMTFDSGRTVSFIYRRDGDMLLLGLIWKRGAGLPNSFTDKDIHITTYRRAK
jgi:uncharacterized protein (TIGR03067 family)